MRKIYLLLTMFCAAGLLRAADDDGINWLGSYREALRVAKETGKPIFLEFRCEA